MEVSTKNEAEGNGGCRNQESNGTEETTAVEYEHGSGMEGEFVVWECVEESGKEQSPARVKAPPQKRRTMIRVESKEVQDYVSEQQGHEEIDVQEMEELSFIPSAVSEPRWALHMSDNKCCKEAFKFYQLTVFAAHTINLCEQCYNVMRLKRGERKVTASRWRDMIEQKAFRGKLWVAFWHGAICARLKAIGNRSRRTERSWSLLGTAVTCALNVYSCVVPYYAGRSGDWETASTKVRECYNEENHRAKWWRGRCHLVVPVPSLSFLPTLRTTLGGSLVGTERNSVTGDVPLVAATMIGGLRTGSWSCKTARTPEKQKCFDRTLHRKECATT